MPSKVFGYMAAGLPAIASSFALWGRVVEVTDRGIAVNLTNRRDVVKAMHDLVDDPDDVVRRSANGKKAVFEQYDGNTRSRGSWPCTTISWESVG